MKEKNQNAAAEAIIGGADGPTSVFVSRPGAKQPLRLRIQNRISKYKRKRAEKKIVPGTHTLEEVAAYAMENFGAAEVGKEQPEYMVRQEDHKENLLLRHKPELLGPFQMDLSDMASVSVFLQQRQERREWINKIPDSELPMDLHIYEIKEGHNCLDIEIDPVWNVFSVSYSGSKKAMKQFHKIVRELYLYYGVSEADIQEKTERYYSLLGVLS